MSSSDNAQSLLQSAADAAREAAEKSAGSLSAYIEVLNTFQGALAEYADKYPKENVPTVNDKYINDNPNYDDVYAYHQQLTAWYKPLIGQVGGRHTKSRKKTGKSKRRARKGRKTRRR
jgi:hypothetical protein